MELTYMHSDLYSFKFLAVIQHYIIDLLPSLGAGFLLSGIIHEFIPTIWVERHLSKGGFKAILVTTLVGTVLPLCCWGTLPVALSFYKKGCRLGPILAFLVATPATSASALAVSWRLLGPFFTIYIFFSVVLMGLIVGILGDVFKFESKRQYETPICPECKDIVVHCEYEKGSASHLKSVVRFAFWDMPKEIGLEIIIGLILASLIATFIPVGIFIRQYLSGALAYPFSIVFGLIMYFCSTASVPFVDALLKQGMNLGAGVVLLLVGPITSYGTMLVLKKEFGIKLLSFYLISITVLAVILGYFYQWLMALF